MLLLVFELECLECLLLQEELKKELNQIFKTCNG
jgi:hypothetical protein